MDDPQPSWGYLGPEMSRRARAFPVWATLRAYGRSGYRAIVEHDLDLAAHLARIVDEAPDLERLADVQLNIVCFRSRPPGFPEDKLDELNRRIGEAALLDGRVFFGSTLYGGRVAFRPAPVSWRQRPEDMELVATVVRELSVDVASGL
jgi:glutamate/tyrosine decarboxylase-like PLP-dependent enzyme